MLKIKLTKPTMRKERKIKPWQIYYKTKQMKKKNYKI